MQLKKELNNATDIDTADLAAESDFIALKAEVDKLEINKLVNVPTSLNNLKAKVDDLDISKLNAVPVNLKTLTDAVSKEVVKNTKFSKLYTKINSLENKNPDSATLIHVNQYNTNKQSLKKKNYDVDKKEIPDVSGLVTTTVLITKIGKVESKIPNTSGLVNTTVSNAKIGEIENKIPVVVY